MNRLPPFLRFARRTRLALELLLGRRLLLFVAVDLLVVGAAVLAMLLGEGDEPAAVWSGVVLPPFLLLGLPALAATVDMERRAGCLDLALAAPASEKYFVRRTAAVCTVLWAQGSLLMLVDWLHESAGFPLLSVVVQAAVVSLFLGAASLFWAVRLKTSGAVWLASMATLLVLGRWFFFNPVPDLLFGKHGALLPWGEDAIAWLGSLGVLIPATAILFLYARRRLRRPETMIS